MLISGVIGHVGNLMIVEADTFFGHSVTPEGQGITIEESEVEMCGLRQYKQLSGHKVWTGQKEFDDAADTIKAKSRGFIFGANALQLAFGKMPDYKLEHSKDFGITSESCLEWWMGVQKTCLLYTSPSPRDS